MSTFVNLSLLYPVKRSAATAVPQLSRIHSAQMDRVTFSGSDKKTNKKAETDFWGTVGNWIWGDKDASFFRRAIGVIASPLILIYGILRYVYGLIANDNEVFAAKKTKASSSSSSSTTTPPPKTAKEILSHFTKETLIKLKELQPSLTNPKVNSTEIKKLLEPIIEETKATLKEIENKTNLSPEEKLEKTAIETLNKLCEITIASLTADSLGEAKTLTKEILKQGIKVLQESKKTEVELSPLSTSLDEQLTALRGKGNLSKEQEEYLEQINLVNTKAKRATENFKEIKTKEIKTMVISSIYQALGTSSVEFSKTDFENFIKEAGGVSKVIPTGSQEISLSQTTFPEIEEGHFFHIAKEEKLLKGFALPNQAIIEKDGQFKLKISIDEIGEANADKLLYLNQMGFKAAVCSNEKIAGLDAAERSEKVNELLTNIQNKSVTTPTDQGLKLILPEGTLFEMGIALPN